MKAFNILAALVFFCSLGAIFAAAQAVPISSQKIAIIRSDEFSDEKSGITKLVGALKQLQVEFKTQQDELITLETKLEAISKDIQTLSAAATVDQKAVSAKNDEGEKTQSDYNRKKEDYNTAFEKRFAAIISPIQNDIGIALGNYSKQKGIQMVLDLSKDEKGILIWIDTKTADITEDFIKYYNTRPPAAAAPK